MPNSSRETDGYVLGDGEEMVFGLQLAFTELRVSRVVKITIP